MRRKRREAEGKRERRRHVETRIGGKSRRWRGNGGERRKRRREG